MAEQQGTADKTAITSSGSGASQPTPSTSSTPNGAITFALPPDIAKAYPGLTKFKDLASLAKSYGELEKFSSGALRVPGADAPQEERDAFYTKLGRPESPDKYEIKFAEGTNVDENLLGAFRGVAHKLGLSQSQAQSLGEWWAGQATAQGEIQNGKTKDQIAEWDKELTTDWGWAKERNTALAGRLLNKVAAGGDGAAPFPDALELAKYLDSSGLGNHPTMIKFFHHLAVNGVKGGEDRLIMADAGPNADDRQTAKEQINAIRGDKEHPYNLPKHPSHKDAIRHMQALYDIVYEKEK